MSLVLQLQCVEPWLSREIVVETDFGVGKVWFNGCVGANNYRFFLMFLVVRLGRDFQMRLDYPNAF